MPLFAYTARDSSGAASNGTVEAASIQEVSSMLRSQGKFPTSVTEAAEERESAKRTVAVGSRGIKIPRADLIHFSQQLAIMVETGVTLSDALDCIAQQTVKPHTKALVSDLIDTVRGGTDFSAALQRHPRSFPRLYVSLVKASEKS